MEETVHTSSGKQISMRRRRDFSGAAFPFSRGDAPLPRVKTLLQPWTLRLDCRTLLPPHDVSKLEQLSRDFVRLVDCCEIRLVGEAS